VPHAIMVDEVRTGTYRQLFQEQLISGKEDAASVVTSVPSVSVCWATIIKFSACG
jgi:hypothetical protein